MLGSQSFSQSNLAEYFLLFYIASPNKTENPSKNALDKTENYANCDQSHYTNQTNRSCPGDQTRWGGPTLQGDQGDQTNIPTG